VLAVILFAFAQKPTVWVRLEITGLNAQPAEATRECSIGTDAIAWTERTTTQGPAVSVAPCFGAQRHQNGSMLVPCRSDADGTIWGYGPNSDCVKQYVAEYVRTFRLSLAQEARADAKTRLARLHTLGMAAAAACVGWGVLWGLAWVIGWIVLGFAGIPRGRDSRRHS
jgi:hypothetical protein